MKRGAVVAGTLALLGTLALTASGAGDVTGTYDIATSEGLKGFLYVREDLMVRRRVLLPDKTVRSQFGPGKLDGDKLTVTFTGKGDPHDLSGDWTVTGDAGATGRYRGTATFTRAEERWTTTFTPSDVDDKEPLPAVELGGTLTVMTFRGERNGVAVVYSLTPDGLTLASRAETFKRSTLVLNGGPTATYTFGAEGVVEGKLSSGVIDRGKRAAVQTAGTVSNQELQRLPIEPDPVPNSLRATRDTKILLGPDGPEGKAVKKDELVHVCGRKGDLWVVGPFREGKKKWTGFLKAEDLNPRLQYKAVDAPVFLPGKRPSPDSIVQKDLATCYFDAALMAVADNRPTLVENMFRDLKDQTVGVRFHVKDEHGRYVEHWVRVKKTIVVDEKGRSHYTIGEGGQLWPALAEKAFAAWRGKGYYRNIEYGAAHDVFEVILGKPARWMTWPLPLPGEIGATRLKADVPQMTKADRDAIVAFGATPYWKDEAADLVNHPTRRRDFAYIEKLIGKVDLLTPEGEKQLKAFYRQRVEGPLGSARYSPAAKNVFALIEETDKKKRPMCLGTKAWGKAGTGQSGGENIELVAGLASTHEYMVVGTRTDERRLGWIKVMNPWHHFSRRYERKGDELVASAVDGKKDDTKGVFDVELSDLMRYFASLSYVAE